MFYRYVGWFLAKMQLSRIITLTIILATPSVKNLLSIPLKDAPIKRGMRIGVYTGSFDPFHKAHAAIIEKALTLFPFVVVHANQWYQHTKRHRTHYAIRHEMLKAMYQNHPRVLLSIERIVDVTDYLKNKKATISNILGSDNLHVTNHYTDERCFHIRPEDRHKPEIKKLLQTKSFEGQPVTFIKTVPNSVISSTKIKARTNGQPLEDTSLVPGPVQKIIQKYKLYQTGPKP